MSDSLSRIHDDEERYLSLCEKFGEKPRQDKNGWADCYGEHADQLEKRLLRERNSVQQEDKKKDLETEVKIEIDRPKKFDEIYAAIGKPDWTVQRNYIFPFSGNILRLRYEDKTGKAFLTFKGKDRGEEFNSREEKECDIPAELFMSMSRSLSKRPIQDFENQPHYYEKSRAQAKYGNCVVCLDNFFGTYYCEIEGDEKNIRKLITKFGLEDFPREKRSYLEMLGEKKSEKSGRLS